MAVAFAAVIIGICVLNTLLAPGGFLAEAGLSPVAMPRNAAGFERWTMTWDLDAVDRIGAKAKSGDRGALRQLVLGSQFSDGGFSLQIGLHLYICAAADPSSFLQVLESCPNNSQISTAKLFCIGGLELASVTTVAATIDRLQQVAANEKQCEIVRLLVRETKD